MSEGNLADQTQNFVKNNQVLFYITLIYAFVIVAVPATKTSFPRSHCTGSNLTSEDMQKTRF